VAWVAGDMERLQQTTPFPLDVPGFEAPSETLYIAAEELVILIVRAVSESAEGICAPRGIRAEGLAIRGHLDLGCLCLAKLVCFRNCRFEGGITIDDAQLGTVDLSSSEFPFLSGQRVHIEGNLSLDGLRHTDWVDLREACIAGRLSLAGSHLNSGEKKPAQAAIPKHYRHRADQVLHCYGARIESTVWLEEGFTAYGEVSFCAATIGGDLSCIGANFINPTGCALYCAGAAIGSSVILAAARAHGEVNFTSATIGGSAVCNGGSFTTEPGAQSPYGASTLYSALNLSNTRIAGNLWVSRQVSPASSLNLTGTRVDKFIDDGTIWPEKGKLALNGFVYEVFGEASLEKHQTARTPLDFASRAEWLGRQADVDVNFKPQPWTQCAKVLSAMGRTHDAKLMLYERERRWLRSKQQHTVTRLFYRLVLGPLSGYGYKTHYALYWAVGIWLMGALVFGIANDAGMMRPASEQVVTDADYKLTGLPPRDYEPMNALFYSADLLLPIVDLGQERYWIPRNAGEGMSHAAQSFPALPRPVADNLARIVGGRLPKAFYYFEIVMGWLLVSIVIAGFTKILGHAEGN
jgi:hypothetical protein